MYTCPKNVLLILAGLAAKLRDFLRMRRSRHPAVFPFPAAPSPPQSIVEGQDLVLDQDGQPIEEPLVERLGRGLVNPQTSSLLFNGSIPPEVRDRIFEYVLTEDEDVLYKQDTHYARPGYASHKALLTNLLLTCRRVYLEAHHLPLVNREHVFWHHREPEGTGYDDEAAYFSRFRPHQLALVRRVHLFTQQFWLEGHLQGVCRLPVMQTIEQMTITLRRGDWWFWENGNALGINPQRGDAKAHLMRADWAHEAATGLAVPWREHAWGCAFQHLRALRQLEFEFETTVHEEKQLLEIVEHARTWRFPMGQGRVLSAAGQTARRSTWRGPRCVWGNICEGCGRPFSFNSCQVCQERYESRQSGLGPMLVVFSLRWKLAAADDYGH